MPGPLGVGHHLHERTVLTDDVVRGYAWRAGLEMGDCAVDAARRRVVDHDMINARAVPAGPVRRNFLPSRWLFGSGLEPRRLRLATSFAHRPFGIERSSIDPLFREFDLRLMRARIHLQVLNDRNVRVIACLLDMTIRGQRHALTAYRVALIATDRNRKFGAVPLHKLHDDRAV